MTDTKIYNYSPRSNQEVEVGATVSVFINGYNNKYSGRIDVCVVISRGDTNEILVHEVETDVDPRRATERYSSSFTMPDDVVEVYFDVGYVDSGGTEHWEDEEITTLTPITPQPKFKIRAMEDVSTAISGATVTVTGIGTKTTDNNGYTSWFYADYGTYLDVHITADGYEYYNTGDYFNEGEDGMVWTHYLVPGAEYLNVTPLSHNSPAAGESFEISVESNISWEAVDDATWVSIQVSSECGDSPQYGCGDGIITATVDANPGTTSRTWHVTVDGEGESRTRTYTQSGAVIPITCTGTTPNFDTGCALLLYFDTDNDGIISDAELIAAGDAEINGLITSSEFDFVKDAYDAGSINALCSGCFVVPYLTIYPETHSSPAAGESFPITITSNIAWTVTDNQGWLSCYGSSCDGSGDGSTTVTVDANTGTVSRSGSVFVTGEGITRTCVVTQAGAVTPPCSSYTNESSCIAAGCFWYDSACHEYGPVQCSDYTDALTCVANNCYWWSDGTCHDTEEPNGLPTLLLVPTLTTLTLDEELCPEVICETGIDDVCIYIDGTKTTNCANSGYLDNITCIPGDFNKITGAELGVGTHTLQAKSPNASDSNIVNITVTEAPGKETRLTCYDAETVNGNEATLEAKLEYKNLIWHDLAGKTVKFDLGGGTTNGITDSNGVALVVIPVQFVPPAGTYTFTATFVEDDDYDGSTCEGELTVIPTSSLLLVPTLTTLTLDEELCPEVICETGIDDVCIYIDGTKTTNCANSGYLDNITCIPGDFNKITGAELGVGTHTLQAKSPNASDSNIVNITVTEEGTLYIKSCIPTEISNGLYGVTAPLAINAFIKNATFETVEVKLKLTAKSGATIIDTEPDLTWKNISAGEEWTTSVGVPSTDFTELYIKDEWLKVELWEQYASTPTDTIDIKVGDPGVPPDDDETIWKIIADLLNMTVPQVKAIATVGGGLLALSFIMPMFRR